jgi:hypothetical protein
MIRDLIRLLPVRSASGLSVYVAASPAAPFSTSLGMTNNNRHSPIKNRKSGYSHSIVLGGLLEISNTTRLTPFTSLQMRLEMRANSS